MSEYAVYCDKGHRSYRRLVGTGPLADAIACTVSVNPLGQRIGHNAGIVCGAKVEIFKIPPVRATELLRAKYAADGWPEYWSWPGPRYLAARYLDPHTLDEDPERWWRFEPWAADFVQPGVRRRSGETVQDAVEYEDESRHGTAGNEFVHASVFSDAARATASEPPATPTAPLGSDHLDEQPWLRVSTPLEDVEEAMGDDDPFGQFTIRELVLELADRLADAAFVDPAWADRPKHPETAGASMPPQTRPPW